MNRSRSQQSQQTNRIIINDNMNAIRDVYSENKVLLEESTFENQKNVIHNNIGSEIIKKQVFDNKIFIDSSIRNIQQYPEPFKFDVKFGGVAQNTENVRAILNKEIFEYNLFTSGDPQIVIPRNFKNVKSVEINAVIMPCFIHMISQEDGSFRPSTKNCLKHYKYLILKIKELNTFKKYSNNPLINDNCLVLTNNRVWGEDNEYWVPISDTIASYDSRLMNINRLSFELYDHTGKPLQYTLDGEPFSPPSEYKKIIDLVLERQKNKKPADDLFPYLNSLRRLVRYTYPDIHMTITTYEAEINTQPNFSFI